MNSLAPGTWISACQARPEATLRLICFPYAGANASVFRPWASHFPESIELHAVRLARRTAKTEPRVDDRLSAVVQELSHAIQHDIPGPFAFFGHSLGALLAFEIARDMNHRHIPGPLCLFLSGRRAPQLPPDSSPIHDLPTNAFLRELKDLNGTPPEILENAELMEVFLPILRSEIRLAETHVHRSSAPLTCPITVFGGKQDDAISRNALVAWRENTRGAFALRMFPGDHFFIHSSESEVAQAIQTDLAYLGRDL
uniref:Predicted thioesterase n=1 Tax=Karenia brevis TaxID=156230 RepID=D2CZD7_KARBR|nr:predicted thioesterase [Karenia brevis]